MQPGYKTVRHGQIAGPSERQQHMGRQGAVCAIGFTKDSTVIQQSQIYCSQASAPFLQTVPSPAQRSETSQQELQAETAQDTREVIVCQCTTCLLHDQR